MTKEVLPYADKRRQPSIILVSRSGLNLKWLSNTGETGEGPAETVWELLRQKEKYPVTEMNRGKLRKRIRTGAAPIVVCPSINIRSLVITCDATHWSAIRNIKGYKTVTHDGGPTVHRMYSHSSDLENAASTLFPFVEWLNEQGALFNGSISGAAYSLFRTSLTEPLRLYAPELITEVYQGGRVEYFSKPEWFCNVNYLDLPAAYPTVMAEGGMPKDWRPADPKEWYRYPDGFSKARCMVPHHREPPNPLPLRRNGKTVWPSGVFSGVWSHRDMLHAKELGFWIEADETWKPLAWTKAFESAKWQELRQEMRTRFPRLGKTADNALWGMFSFDNTGDRLVRWTDKIGNIHYNVETDLRGFRMHHGQGIGVVTTARVRDKLWSALQVTDSIYCDTDGFMCQASNSIPIGWIKKHRFDVVDIKAPQAYRWFNKGYANWSYLGNSTERDFKAFPSLADRINGNGEHEGSATIRQLHLRGFYETPDLPMPALQRANAQSEGI